jgi:hypothetical protein
VLGVLAGLASVAGLTPTAGCGARSGLDEARADGGVASGDASFFGALPCRWSLGTAIDLARGAAIEAPSGAVHPRTDHVVVAATVDDGREATRMLARLSLRASPERLLVSRGRIPEGPLLSGFERVWVQDGRACRLLGLDAELEPVAPILWGRADRCTVTTLGDGRALTAAISERGDANVVEHAFGRREPAAQLAGPLPDVDEAWAVRAGGATFVAVRRGARASLVRVSARGREEARLAEALGGPFSIAPDGLRAGALVLLRDRSAGWRLLRAGAAGPLAPTELVDLSDLGAAPVGALATNETEALVPLSDGTLAIVPLAGGAIVRLGPVDGAPVSAMEVVLRPGESAGGLLYTLAARDEVALRYQPLICHR